MKPHVIISGGVGRLHFIETAKALLQLGVRFELICGYVPQGWHRPFLDILGPVLGRRGLVGRLAMRVGADGSLKSYLRSNALGEGIAQLFSRLAQFSLVPHSAGQRFAWTLFGWLSRRHIRNQKIFHVRSGAGQGGAIKKARRLGMRIMVDHSIAHPVYIENALRLDYASLGLEPPIRASDPFWRLVMKDCYEADLLMVNSDFVKNTFVEQGYPSEKIEVNYLGVRTDFWGLKENYNTGSILRLLFTGTFEVRKGARVLIEAMEYLQAEAVVFELHIAGNDMEAYRLFGDRLRRLPIIRHGALPQDKLKTLFRDSDVYVFPTFAEGCARSAMEAMYAGLPVITTEACGLPGEPGVHWLEVPSGNAQSLAQAIERLAKSSGLRAEVGLAGVALAQGGVYTWQSYGRKLESLYERLISS